jgi:hypothetical protein
MTLTNYTNGISSFGIPVAGNDIPTTSGNYWFVNSATGLTTGPGTMETPFSSIAYACSTTYNTALAANDVVVVLPGHTETVVAAGGITIATAGVQLIGLGSGASRPTITFSTSTAASMLVSGAGVKTRNIVGVAGIDALTKPLDVTGGTPDLQIEWQDVATTYQAVSAVRMTAVTNAKLDLKYLGTAGSAICLNPVKLAGCTDVEINIDFYGTAGTSVINTVATGASKDVRVHGYMYNSGTTDGSKNFVDTVTGSTWYANIDDGAAGGQYVGGSASAPIVADVSDVAGALYGGAGVVTWPTAAAYASGVSIAEVLAYVQNAVRNGSGTALASNTSLQDVVGTGITGAAGLTLQAALGTTGTAVTDSAVSVLGAIGADNANNAFASTSVAANEDGSVLERLEQIQEAVNKGTGTALASNTSLQDVIGTGITGAAGLTLQAALGTTGTAVTDSAVSVLGAIGADNANNAFASTSVAANEDGSVLERLEQIQEAVNNGTGTSLTTNKSILDVIGASYTGAAGLSLQAALGTTGTATTDSAASLVGIIGSNTATTAFTSAAVVGDADGNVLERLEYLQTVVEKCVATTAATMTMATDDLFVIAGGPIELVSLVGVFQTVNTGAASTFQIQANATAGGATVMSIASSSTSGAAAGTYLVLPAAVGGAVTAVAGGAHLNLLPAELWTIPVGKIQAIVGGAGTVGTVQWYLRYKPLAPGVTVTAAY